jgi:Ca2+-binding RTX toxin-like protein
MSWLKRMAGLKRTPGGKVRPVRSERRRGLAAPVLEPLDRRVMLAVTASLAGGELRVTGDDQDNIIVVSRTVGGAILVNNGAVPILGGTATVATTNHFHIVGAGGNDNLSLDETNGALPGAALFGGAGNDTLTGGSGEDFVDGETGNDTAFLGAGDDTFSWNPGDGSDVVDGQAGKDNVVFNGSDLAERFGISDSGSGLPFHRARLTRDLGNVALDLGTIEDIDLNTLGGADTVTVDDQTVTDLLTVNLDLQGTAGTGDGVADAVIINGTDGEDVAQVSSFGKSIEANVGLFPFVNMIGVDATLDTLTISALGGNDTVDATSLEANVIGLTINSGAGNDEIFGSAGNDSVIGGTGIDKVFLGAGDDTFVWNAGDGSDVVEGQAGTDTLIFNGSNAVENIGVSSNGSRVRVTDDMDAVVMDIDGVEQASFAPLGGADNVVVNDVTGTALAFIKVKLNADGQADNITVNGSNSADRIGVEGDLANGVTVTGLAAQVEALGALGVGDGVTINGLGGADVVDASGLEAGVITLSLNGGDGSDVLTSNAGLVNGGAQTDTINVIGGASSGVVSVLPSSGDDAVNVNADGVGTASVSFDSMQRIGVLTIGSGGVATVTAGGANVLSVTSLGVSGTGKLNLNDNQLIVDYAPLSVSPIASIRSLLTSGFHNGAWDGSGIMSSLSNASTFALGFAEASEVAAGGMFAGQGVDGTAVVVKFTLYGDATLDGSVDFNDLVKLAQNFNTTLPATQGSWSRGDFTFDGVVDFDDLVKLAQHYNTGLPGATAASAPVQRPASVAVEVVRPVGGSAARSRARRHDPHDRR